jgi:hypothetical protein
MVGFVENHSSNRGHTCGEPADSSDPLLLLMPTVETDRTKRRYRRWWAWLFLFWPCPAFKLCR